MVKASAVPIPADSAIRFGGVYNTDDHSFEPHYRYLSHP